MGMIIHIPERERSVSFPGNYSEMADLYKSESVLFAKLSTGYAELIMLIAYLDMVIEGDFSLEEVSTHLEEFYPGMSLDTTLEKSQKMEDRLAEILGSDSFVDKYQSFYEIILRNVFTIFAAGAIANEDGDVSVISTPVELRNRFSTKA